MTNEKLLHAQQVTLQLFEAVEKCGLIKPGKTDRQLADEITALAAEQFGLHRHWHKKIVRTGANTLATYSQEPTAVTIQEDDILFIDFGPIVDDYEADLGRTYIIGNDPLKQRIKQDVEKAWYETREWINAQQELKCSVLFQYVVDKAKEYGWTFTGDIAGHIVGKYPHEQPLDPKSLELDIHPQNHNNIFLKDAAGNERYWILELQFIDAEKGTGAYFEQLLCTPS